MTNIMTERSKNELQIAYSYYLSHLSHLGERSALKFKLLFPTYESLVQLSQPERLEATKRLLGNESTSVISTNFDALIDQSLTAIKNHQGQGIHVYSIDCNEYPALLKKIPDPPLILFVKGLIDCVWDNSNVAVVGTRDATSAGEKVAFKIAKWLGEHKWTVVSGLAKGIDSAAHRGALGAEFRTAAVMATPLNKVYPAENRQLATDILDHGGCWISELPLSKKPHRGAFVQRDRIQSGISVAVVPVQTDIEGGTMHTVRYAEKQKRLLLCPKPIPSEQFVKQYAGVKNLIDTGRATSFSGDEYGRVLESLIRHRAALLGISPRERGPSVNEDLADNSRGVPVRRAVDESGTKSTGDLTLKQTTRLQSGFSFIDESRLSNGSETQEKFEKEIHLQLLQQLRNDLSQARRPDGTVISNLHDVKEWLDEKIELLRRRN
jgi:DNA processing protein